MDSSLPKQVCAISWHKPSPEWFKLKVEGSSLNNLGESGDGGVLRNHDGKLQFAFTEYTGIGSNNRVELMVFLLGLRRCKLYGFNNVILELDSLLIVNWLKEDRCNVWYLEDFWEEICSLLRDLNVQFQHVFREGNSAVDWLAQLGSRGCTDEFSNENFPHLLKGILRIDRRGLNLRICS
ncbi:uncharacterized protein LOC121249518 [Juglans microcarpa x Juglans regia]|uniref:uncharacterized protein LOC121249518 n=1 Tax=Juglans microcarpa x Juglans regia TaxID=2249226 RepID=UPI001B7ED4B1|nr:uncharacterized protein LOC121249518 [Juglans microcarpa x Juglans regia]